MEGYNMSAGQKLASTICATQPSNFSANPPVGCVDPFSIHPAMRERCVTIAVTTPSYPARQGGRGFDRQTTRTAPHTQVRLFAINSPSLREGLDVP